MDFVLRSNLGSPEGLATRCRPAGETGALSGPPEIQAGVVACSFARPNM